MSECKHENTDTYKCELDKGVTRYVCTDCNLLLSKDEYEARQQKAYIKQLESRIASLEEREQPKLTVKLQSFPESNGKRNWTALLVRVDKWGGLVSNCGGISIAYGELWNRVAYEAERTKLLIGERDTEPCIMDYGEDIETPEEWKGETRGGRKINPIDKVKA